MGKKQVAVSLRKPPPADQNAFVAGAVPADAAAPPPGLQTAMDAPTVQTKTGERREMTIYLPQDIARKLSIRCVELDRDVSNLVAEALAKALDVEQPVAVVVPADRWTKVRGIVNELRGLVPVRFVPAFLR
jgi:hypothetical protein